MVDVDLGGIESEKSKMSRWQIGNGSLSVLEQVYSLDPFPGLDARRELAKQLNVSPRQVQVWFQNKRQRERKISRAKGQLSTPGLPDTPAQAAQVERARAGPGRPSGLEAGMAAGDAPGGLSGGALSLSGAAGSAATLGMPPLQGGSCGGPALLQPPAPGEPPRDSIFGLPMTRSCSNPAGFGQLGCGGGGVMDLDGKVERDALDRLGLSPVEPERRARKLGAYDASPLARSMSLDPSLLSAPRHASLDALGLAGGLAGGIAEGGMGSAAAGGQRGGLGAPRLPWLSGIGRGMTALNSADHVDMCRQAVAAAAAAFGKPGGLSGQARSPPFDPARGGQGGHLPVAPSPFDSQLVQQSLGWRRRGAASFAAPLGDAGSYEGGSFVPPSGGLGSLGASLGGGLGGGSFLGGGGVRGRSALRDGRTESLDSEGVIPCLDELAAMEELPDDLQQAIAAISDGNQGNHFEVKPAADVSFDVGRTPACSDVCRSKAHSPAVPAGAALPLDPSPAARVEGRTPPHHDAAPGGLFAGAPLQGEPMKRSGVSFIMDDMSLGGSDLSVGGGLEGGLEGQGGAAALGEASGQIALSSEIAIPSGGMARAATPAEGSASLDAPPSLLSSSHDSQSSVGVGRADSSFSSSHESQNDEPAPLPSATAATAKPQPAMSSTQPAMSSTEASDMQAAADSYVQVILSGEAPYQIVWASEAWLKLVGYSNDEACGKTLKLVEGPLTSQASVEQLTRAIRAGSAVRVAMTYHACSGRAFSHEMRVEPLKDSLGLVQCFQVTSAEVHFLKAEAAPGQYPLTEPAPLTAPPEPEPEPSTSAAPLGGGGLGGGAGKGDAPGAGSGRFEIDEMLEWLDSGTGLKEQSAECLI